MRFCLLTMELDPFNGGGYGATVRALAGELAGRHEVTVAAVGIDQSELDEMTRQSDPRLTPGVRYVEVRPVPDAAGRVSPAQAVADASLSAVRRVYGPTGPDVVVSADFLGQSAELLRAREEGDAALAHTKFVVRTAGTAEICALHNHDRVDPVSFGPICELERSSLRDADLLWVQSKRSLADYATYYGPALAPHAVLPTPELPTHVLPRRPHAPREPLRFLYVGRLERRKGVLDLAAGFAMVENSGWTLTLVGGDTYTGPNGGSVVEAIQGLRDSRIHVVGRVPREQLPELLAEHDVYVAPAQWETWGHSPCEALASGLPLLCTPTGGFPEMAGHGEYGWVCDDVGPLAIARGLRTVLADRERAIALRRDPALPRHIERLADPSPLVSALESLGEQERRKT